MEATLTAAPTWGPRLAPLRAHRSPWPPGRKRKPYVLTEDEHADTIWKPLVFRVDETTPRAVQSVLLELGWQEFDRQAHGVDGWNLYWKTSSFRMAEHTSIKPWQRLNHHPGTTKLTRKDHLAKCLMCMRRIYGTSLYEFIPQTFVMPGDYNKFVAAYSKEKQMLGTKHSYWICKPAELSRGRGILIFRDIKDLIFDDNDIVQKYICNPLLVGRYKCDLRVYVCVTAFKPLTIHMYQEGLVRFATEKFDLSNLQNDYAHLTNSSINAAGASYEKIKEVIGHGCKWTLSRFFSYLRSCNVDHLLLWQKISHMAILTVLAIAPSVPCAANCFELFGFDVLIDDDFKPWLLEVNYSPALTLGCKADVTVKRKLLHDIVGLIHLSGPGKEGKECGSAARGHSGGSFARGNPGRLGPVRSPLPCASLFHFTSRACKNDESKQRALRACPKDTRTSQLREVMTRQKNLLLPAREPPKVKPKLKGQHTPRTALAPSLSLPPSSSCRTNSNSSVPSDRSKERDPQAGNFVLIFPFNEATFGASRNGLNVKRIVQELQKQMNKHNPNMRK
ncbi:putative tubulin polyglutamylase TTLL2 [Tamandua tetradactyla]|uniref:putative tubulin polyglutamylase TTLL2 n=1 Tax=Tamandua tetradactyla TaxID=48850 RepID=UPI0040544401